MKIEFFIPEEEVARLDRLATRFAQGDRSAFLLAAMNHMEVWERAERLVEISNYGNEKLVSKGIRPEQISAFVKRVLAIPEKRQALRQE